MIYDSNASRDWVFFDDNAVEKTRLEKKHYHFVVIKAFHAQVEYLNVSLFSKYLKNQKVGRGQGKF